MKKEFDIRELKLKEHLFYAYANLAMAHSAINNKQIKYDKHNYAIRAKLYKGLLEGKMNIGTLFEDEKIKLSTGIKCNYCHSTERLALDHILAQKLGGKDNGDNLVYACKTCNSSKGKKDLIEWMFFRGDVFLPLMIIRRYLKLVITYCIENELMDLKISEIELDKVPYKLLIIPVKYPSPDKLILN